MSVGEPSLSSLDFYDFSLCGCLLPSSLTGLAFVATDFSENAYAPCCRLRGNFSALSVQTLLPDTVWLYKTSSILFPSDPHWRIALSDHTKYFSSLQ